MNLERRISEFEKYYQKEKGNKTQGWATTEGTEKYMKMEGKGEKDS